MICKNCKFWNKGYCKYWKNTTESTTTCSGWQEGVTSLKCILCGKIAAYVYRGNSYCTACFEAHKKADRPVRINKQLIKDTLKIVNAKKIKKDYEE